MVLTTPIFPIGMQYFPREYRSAKFQIRLFVFQSGFYSSIPALKRQRRHLITPDPRELQFHHFHGQPPIARHRPKSFDPISNRHIERINRKDRNVRNLTTHPQMRPHQSHPVSQKDQMCLHRARPIRQIETSRAHRMTVSPQCLHHPIPTAKHACGHASIDPTIFGPKRYSVAQKTDYHLGERPVGVN